MEESDFDFTIKLLIVGDTCVGKTNFISVFMGNTFSENYMTTSGIDLKTTKIEIRNKKIRIQLWDTAGQEKYRAITKTLFLKVQGILILYDITKESSFNHLKDWIKSIREECGSQIQLLIVGNKSDLNESRIIEKEKALAYAEEEKIKYIETSSKTGENIQKAISLLCEKIIDNTEISGDFSFTIDAGSLSKKNKGKCC